MFTNLKNAIFLPNPIIFLPMMVAVRSFSNHPSPFFLHQILDSAFSKFEVILLCVIVNKPVPARCDEGNEWVIFFSKECRQPIQICYCLSRKTPVYREHVQ